MKPAVVAVVSPSLPIEAPVPVEGHAPFAGKYVVERILGQGGMGVVFEARHIRLGQRVAIKVLGSALREYPELVQRFEREARAAGSLSSVHAVRVFDIDATEDGTPFIVMELLAGRDLAQLVEQNGAQPVARSVRWVIEACDAIAEAHRLGIIHRDLKPSNLFLSDVEGRSLVKVLDFGIAKRVAAQEVAITQAVAPLGTPQYMSPEQVRCAKDVDARTDVWSLGVTLYELVTGQTPFAHDSASACIAAIAADPVPDPRVLRADLPEEFVKVVMRALQKNAADRFQSIEELVAAIAPFASLDEDGESVSAVRRAISGLPPAYARERKGTGDVTADAVSDAGVHIPRDSASTPVGPGASYQVRTFEVTPAREPAESRSDRTVPPAVSMVGAPARRRFGSPLVVLSAGVLGLAALAFVPRLIAPATEARAAAASHAPIAAAHVAASEAAPGEKAAARDDVSAALVAAAAAVTEEEAKAAEAPSARAARAPARNRVEVAPGTNAKALVAPPLVPALAPASAPEGKDPAARARGEKPASQATSSRSVHGGLSNPGF